MPGGACCAAQICCPPIKGSAAPEAVAALSDWLYERMGGAETTHDDAEDLAAEILKQWDLAPKGTAQAVLDGWEVPPEARAGVIGAAVVDLYAELMAEKAKGGA